MAGLPFVGLKALNYKPVAEYKGSQLLPMENGAGGSYRLIAPSTAARSGARSQGEVSMAANRAMR